MNTPSASQPLPHPLQILVADDHEEFRHTLSELISAEPDMEVVAEVPDGEQAVWLARSLRPDRLDLILMDVEMPRLDGIRATQQINAADPSLPIVMLTVSMLDRTLFAAVSAGAVGYLSKGVRPEALVRALRDFRRDGALPMSRVMAGKVLEYFRAQHAPRTITDPNVRGGLSPREREVLQLIATGARDRDIADQLMIAQRTVKKHVESILHKLHARNRAEAAARLHEFDRPFSD
jgi:DNA-binding NarL/FixJ family response regulator